MDSVRGIDRRRLVGWGGSAALPPPVRGPRRHRPAGDAILDRRVVACDDFGCQFTVGVRADFVAPACP
jgi:hypothetical protein